MVDPVEEFIGQQLHSVSNMDAGMMPTRPTGRRTIAWWPYQHHKASKSFNTGSHEDRLIGAIDKKRKTPKTREDAVEDLLSKAYRKQEVAAILGVSHDTITRDVKKIRGRLRLCLELKK